MQFDTLNSERFVDAVPAAVHAMLLHEGPWLGSVRTIYWMLAINGGCRERRDQLVLPAYTTCELLALAPNQVWSWDIAKLKGPAKMDVLPSVCDPGHLQPPCRGWLLPERKSAKSARAAVKYDRKSSDQEPEPADRFGAAASITHRLDLRPLHMRQRGRGGGSGSPSE